MLFYEKINKIFNSNKLLVRRHERASKKKVKLKCPKKAKMKSARTILEEPRQGAVQKPVTDVRILVVH